MTPSAKIATALALTAATLALSAAAVASMHPHRHHARHPRRHHPRHPHRHIRRNAVGASAHPHPAAPVAQSPVSAGSVSGVPVSGVPVSAVPVPAQCVDADVPAAAASAAAMRAAVVCRVNQQRVARGLPALNDSAQLDRSAQGWTDTMVQTGAFTHGPGDAFAARISDAGYDWQDAGENIGTGFATPRTVVAAWMASEDHCRNILAPQFADIGTGVIGAPVAGFATGGRPGPRTLDFR